MMRTIYNQTEIDSLQELIFRSLGVRLQMQYLTASVVNGNLLQLDALDQGPDGSVSPYLGSWSIPLGRLAFETQLPEFLTLAGSYPANGHALRVALSNLFDFTLPLGSVYVEGDSTKTPVTEGSLYNGLDYASHSFALKTLPSSLLWEPDSRLTIRMGNYNATNGSRLIIEGALGNLTVGDAVSAFYRSVNAIGKTVFTLSGGALPPGITLTTTGLLVGMATTTGPYQWTVQAVDAAGTIGTINDTTLVDNPASSGSGTGGSTGGSSGGSGTGSGGTAPYTPMKLYLSGTFTEADDDGSLGGLCRLRTNGVVDHAWVPSFAPASAYPGGEIVADSARNLLWGTTQRWDLSTGQYDAAFGTYGPIRPLAILDNGLLLLQLMHEPDGLGLYTTNGSGQYTKIATCSAQVRGACSDGAGGIFLWGENGSIAPVGGTNEMFLGRVHLKADGSYDPAFPYNMYITNVKANMATMNANRQFVYATNTNPYLMVESTDPGSMGSTITLPDTLTMTPMNALMIDYQNRLYIAPVSGGVRRFNPDYTEDTTWSSPIPANMPITSMTPFGNYLLYFRVALLTLPSGGYHGGIVTDLDGAPKYDTGTRDPSSAPLNFTKA